MYLNHRTILGVYRLCNYEYVYKDYSQYKNMALIHFLKILENLKSTNQLSIDGLSSELKKYKIFVKEYKNHNLN